jgi:potassium efflux system protein
LARRLAAGLLVLLSFLAALPDAGAQEQTPQRPFSTILEDWNRTFDLITRDLQQGDVSLSRAGTLRKNLADIEAEAKKVKDNAQAAADPLEVQLKALGAPPAEGQPPEAREIAAQRKKIEDDLAAYQGRIKQADLALTKVKDLGEQVTAATLKRSIRRLFEAYPLPLAPATIGEAVPDFFGVLGSISRSPIDWWQSLSPSNQDVVLYRIALFLVPALLIAWVLRLGLLRYFGRDPAIEHPTYARRLTGAIVEGLARGMVPSFILAAVILRAQSDSTLMSGPFADVMVALCGVTIMFIIAWAVSRAVLAPDLPAWRLLPVSAEHARIISRRVTYLAGIFAVDLFLQTSSDGLAASAALVSLYTLVSKSVEAAAILLLIQGRMWAWEEESSDATEPEDTSAPANLRSRFWPFLRRAAFLLSVASVVAAIAGYASFSRYLIESLVISGMAIGVLFLARGLVREVIGVAVRSRLMQVHLAIPHKARRRYKFWLRTLLDIVVYIGGLVLILIIWGVPAEDIYTWTQRILQGFTIGNVTISLSDIFIALVVFIAAMTLTRAAQRLLSERVFPQTDLDLGIQNSLTSGLGYVGLAIAVMLAISAIGLDLSNIALIAGALSVGIGFGLQAVVNNFVSGLILLIERPIKVGDWVVVGGYEGTVKRINVRATEIQTFQRASVIVPNSELISGAVTNWTYKDKYGRVEIPVGVAYGSNVEHVISTIKDCLTAHSDILPWPEPYVLFRAFGDSSLDFEARGYISNVERRIFISSEIRIAIEKALGEAGIEIPFPQRDLHIRSAPGLDLATRQHLAAAGATPKPSESAPPPAERVDAGADSDSDD